MLRATLDANETLSLVANKVVCPVLRVRGDLSLFVEGCLTGDSVDGIRDRSKSGTLGRTWLSHGSCLGRLDIRVPYAISSCRLTGSNPARSVCDARS